MSVEKTIISALRPIGWPVESGVYTGDADKYIVFSYTSLGDDYSDDEAQHERVLLQIHIFAPLAFNVTKTVKDVKNAINAVGFTWPSREDLSDEDGRHVVLECEGAVEAERDGEI